MGANNQPIFPGSPAVGNANLTAVSACTTRAPIATANLATNNLVQLVPTTTNGLRIDKIQVQAASSSITSATAAQLVQLWLYDGTTAWLIAEIAVTAITPSTTAAGFNGAYYPTNLVIPATYSLYVSTTVATTASTTALIVTAFGGDY